MKKITFIRSNQINSDSRAEKYLHYFDDNNIDYTIIGWDRNGISVQRKNTIYYRRKVGFAIGGLKAAINRLYWFRYVIKTLVGFKDKPEFIHACDLDCAFPAVLYKIFFNKNAFILFDVFDWMSHDVAAESHLLIKKVIELMEGFTLHHSDKLFICEEERKQQIPNSEKYSIDVLPNIPMVDNMEKICVAEDLYKFSNNLITLSYVGGLGGGRNIDELLELAKNKKINLLIAGYGNSDLESKCANLNEQDNVKYFGRVEYFDGLRIMYNSDVIYAMYCKRIKNHIFAAPNKYYESLMLGKPLITTAGIIVADKVNKYDTGYAIEEEYSDLVKLIDSIDINDARQKGERAKKIWDEYYSTYLVNFLNQNYSALLD